MEALRVAVHRPQAVASSLRAELFEDPLCRSAFEALERAATLQEAVASADGEVAGLLARLGVEDTDAEALDVAARLIDRATGRELARLQEEARRASDPIAYARTVEWVKLRTEELRSERMRPEAAEQLVAWVVARVEERG